MHSGFGSLGASDVAFSPLQLVAFKFTSQYQYHFFTLPPTPNAHFFSGYDVDPLLKKEVFTMENQVFQKMP